MQESRRYIRDSCRDILRPLLSGQQLELGADSGSRQWWCHLTDTCRNQDASQPVNGSIPAMNSRMSGISWAQDGRWMRNASVEALAWRSVICASVMVLPRPAGASIVTRRPCLVFAPVVKPGRRDVRVPRATPVPWRYSPDWKAHSSPPFRAMNAHTTHSLPR